MQKILLKFAPYLVVIIVFTVASTLIAWDINTTQRNTNVSLFLLKEKGISLLRSLEANLLTIQATSLEQLSEILEDYSQQNDIDFVAISDAEGKIFVANKEEIIGETVPIESPYTTITRQNEYINSHIPFTPENLQNSKVFIVQKHLFNSRINRQFEIRHHHKNNFKHRQLRCLSKIQGLCESSNDSMLFLLVGFNTEQLLQAKLIDDKKSLINLIAFIFLILLGLLSFFLLKKYQQSYKVIEEAKAYFDGLMTTIPLGIITIDSSYKIITINPIAQAMLGNKALINKNIFDYIPAIHDFDFNKPIINSMIKTKNDTQNNLELNSFPINIDNDNKGFGIILRDLKEIQKLQEELTRKDKLASIGQLAAGIAHEIRNPLSSIKGFARIFEENAQEGSEEKMLAKIMTQEILRVDKVISDLMDISKSNVLNIHTIKLEKVIKQAQDAVLLKAKNNNVEIKQNIHIDTIDLDADRMIQIFHNIFLNAIEAMPNGGLLTITTEETDKDYYIKISDTGHGIAQDKLSQLFTPYFTTKAKGTGLGLVIVQKIIEAHKGKIQVESEPNKGTTFIITLPKQR